MAIPLIIGGIAAASSGTTAAGVAGTAAVIGAAGLAATSLQGSQFLNFPNSTAGSPPGPASIPTPVTGRPVVVSPPIPGVLTFANAATVPLTQEQLQLLVTLIFSLQHLYIRKISNRELLNLRIIV